MYAKIVNTLETVVATSIGTAIGSAVYEIGRAWINYRFLDEESPGYKFKNGFVWEN